MHRFEVIESRAWRSNDGRTASLYGAVPYVGEADRIAAGWEVVSRGFTVRDNVNGTIGIGRVPFATAGEAQQWVDAAHARRAGSAVRA